MLLQGVASDNKKKEETSLRGKIYMYPLRIWIYKGSWSNLDRSWTTPESTLDHPRNDILQKRQRGVSQL